MKNIDSLKIASKLLKSQRKKKEFTVEEVCIELKLDREIILDLEAGNFNNFKSYFFLKGYIKNYANFLGVDVSLPESEVKKNKKFSFKKVSDDYSRKNKKVSIFIITILIFIVIFYIFKNQYKNPYIDNKNINIEKIENNIPIKSTDENNDIIEEESKNTQKIDMDDNKIFLEKSLDSNDNLSSLNDNDVNSENVRIDISASANTAHDFFLEITYKGDSWTEIINSKGEIIFLDLVKRGKTIKFNILAPFEILLGDATVVDVKYNNKIISIPYFNPDTNVGKIKVKK